MALSRRLIISLLVSELDSDLDSRSDLLAADLTRLASSGMSAAAVTRLMQARIEEMISSMAHAATTQIRESINSMVFTSYWEKVAQESDYFLWEMEPSAKHCDDCVDRSGKVGTAAEMGNVGFPGSGATKCRQNCRCAIIPITREDYENGTKIS